MPKALRPFFRHDRRLFAEVSRLIYDILRDFYHEAAGRPLLTGMVIAHLRFFAKRKYPAHTPYRALQSFGDQLRWNPHFHAIVLEGGFDDEGTFFYIPFSGLQSMVEVFRRRVIKLLEQRELLNDDFARNLLSWKHSGFSIDNSVRILDESAQESLAEYIARPPGTHGRAGGVSRRPADLSQEDPLRAVQREGPVSHQVLGVLQGKPSHVRRLGLPCRVDATHSTEETPAHPALRALCLPHKGTVERNAMGCGACTGGVASHPPTRRSRGRPSP